MKTVTVSALKAFEYRGHTYQRGDQVAMPPLDAAGRARTGHVTLSRSSRTLETRHMAADPVQSQQPPRRNRRAAKTEGETPPAAERSRRYRRSDMTAEESK